ncbi:MAG: beta-lactamase family protein [Oscillospiraceae bacterium]|nr:beta-lactamase family protein [Oscillospiraceae bacterium]
MKKALAFTLALGVLWGAAPFAEAGTTAAETSPSSGLSSHYDADRAMGFTARVRLDDALDELVRKAGPLQVPGFGIIVYKDGHEVYSRFVGSRHIDGADPRGSAPVTRDTRFRIASVSKQFTAFTLMQLVEQGRLRLDDDVSKYLGFSLRNPAYPDTPITLEMLASHTSSLRDGDNYMAPPDVSIREFFVPQGRMWEGGAHFAPKGEAPGKFFHYCNLNYGLLGTVIEAVTGERFDLYQKKHILKQLSTMADYVPDNLSRAAFSELGTLYRRQKADGQWDETAPWRSIADDYTELQIKKDTIFIGSDRYSLKGYVPGTDATSIAPQGGLRISFAELGHALEMLMNDGVYRGRQVLQPTSVAEIYRPRWVYDPAAKNGDTYDGTLLNYGLGQYRVYGDSTGRVCRDRAIDLLGHTGEAQGLLSGMFFRPGTKDGFLYALNGLGIEPDEDPRSVGRFSGNYIWEEKIMDAVCRALWGKESG